MQGKMRQDLYRELYQVENNHWWHIYKRQVVLKFVLKYCQKKGKVLDIGSGTGKILEELKNKGWKIYGIDGESEAVKWSKKRGIKIKKADLNRGKLPFEKNSFDLVLALDFLEHVENEAKILKEIKRVLKKDGIFIATVPAYQKFYSYWDKMLGHKKRYNFLDFKRLICKNNFRIVFISFYFCLHLLPAILVRLFKLGNKDLQKQSDFLTLPLKPISLPIIKLYNRFENFLIGKVKFPFGLSLICVSKNI